MTEHVLDSLGPGHGRVTCLFAKDTAAAHASVESWAYEERAPHTLVTLEWEYAPRLANGLDDSANALAEAVFALFPSIYESARERANDSRFFEKGWRRIPLEQVVTEAVSRVPNVSTTAARSIVRACQRGELAKLDRLPAAERVRQLSLALDPTCLAIVLLVHEPEPVEPGALLAFGKGAEWLARNSGARVLMVIPQAFATSAELDSVRYGARRVGESGLEPLESAPTNCPPQRSAPPAAAHRPRTAPPMNPTPGETFDPLPAARTPAPLVSVNPIIGRPHPGSEAEILLYKRITTDPELGPLFRYNQLVVTKHGVSTPRVDVIWPEGRLVVEIDSYADHARRTKFCQDRERDYYLLVSGYRVLRILDMTVLIDPELTLERIRTAVRYLWEERNVF